MTPIIVTLISCLLMLNYIAYKSPTEHKMISQKTVYSLGTTKDFTVSLYSNHVGAYQSFEAVDKVSIEDMDGKKKLDVNLEKISKSRRYKYLDEFYQKYNYHINLPNLNAYFYIEEAYLNIRLKNGEETKFLMGSFDYYQSDQNELDLVELYGRKNQSFPYLDKVSLKLNLDSPIFIEYMVISNSDIVTVNQLVETNNLVEINIPQINKTVNQISLKLIYLVNGERKEAILPYYLFYETLDNPLDYGLLNHVYLFD